MLRRTKTIVFDDNPDSDDTDAPAPSARRDLGGRPSLRKGPVLMARDTAEFLPQRESIDETSPPNPVHARQDFLRSEFENEPITRGSQDTLAALRADFRRKHVTVDEDESGGFSLPSFSLGGKAPLPPTAAPLLGARPRFARPQYTRDETIAFRTRRF